jgi:hypothetical protein
MNSIDPLKRRVAALIDAQFERTIAKMSNEQLLATIAEMRERRDTALDARARAKAKK